MKISKSLMEKVEEYVANFTFEKFKEQYFDCGTFHEVLMLNVETEEIYIGTLSQGSSDRGSIELYEFPNAQDHANSAIDDLEDFLEECFSEFAQEVFKDIEVHHSVEQPRQQGKFTSDNPKTERMRVTPEEKQIIEEIRDKSDLIYTLSQRITEFTGKIEWDRERTEGDDEEVIHQLFGNYHYLQFQSQDDLEWAVDISDEDFLEIIKKAKQIQDKEEEEELDIDDLTHYITTNIQKIALYVLTKLNSSADQLPTDLIDRSEEVEQCLTTYYQEVAPDDLKSRYHVGDFRGEAAATLRSYDRFEF